MEIKNPISTVLFDLDGTLLNVDMYRFVPDYLKYLSASIDVDLDVEQFVQVMIDRTMQRLRSDDGSQTNQDFFLAMAQCDLQITPQQFLSGLQYFYRQHMEKLQPLVTTLPIVPQILQLCFAQGLTVVIATNPVFPRPLVDARLRWAGIDGFPYRLITSSENSCYCKPNPNYFKAILAEIDCSPAQCLMVGNDTEHDLSAAEVGISTFLVDTWLIERRKSYTADCRGDHHDLYRCLDNLVVTGCG